MTRYEFTLALHDALPGVRLTAEMRRVLAIALRDGSVIAGVGAYAGHVERVAASTVSALIKRGLLVHVYGSEGNLGGKLPAFDDEVSS